MRRDRSGVGTSNAYILCQEADFAQVLVLQPSTVVSNSISAMRRALLTEQEVWLATEQRLKYLGTAKVNINQIQFEPPLPRDLDSKNVARLCEIFRKNQCRCLDINNHVPAIISQQDLAVALQNTNILQ
jgi:hypothetical protein